jgi:hypothetical protein
MFTFRPTAKLAKRLGVVPSSEQTSSTTCLGDWYSNLLRFGHQQMILCVSEKSLLPVVLPARNAKRDFRPMLSAGLESMLRSIGIPPSRIHEELNEMLDWVGGRPLSRSVLGSMNDLSFGLMCRFEDDPNVSLEDLSLELSDTPCSPLAYDSPRDVASRLLTK